MFAFLVALAAIVVRQKDVKGAGVVLWSLGCVGVWFWLHGNVRLGSLFGRYNFQIRLQSCCH
eukprot:scaffold569_cov165-Amphora_coffeaeformis.AAC.14